MCFRGSLSRLNSGKAQYEYILHWSKKIKSSKLNGKHRKNAFGRKVANKRKCECMCDLLSSLYELCTLQLSRTLNIRSTLPFFNFPCVILPNKHVILSVTVYERACEEEIVSTDQSARFFSLHDGVAYSAPSGYHRLLLL